MQTRYTAQIRQHELRSYRSGFDLPWKIYIMEVGTDYLSEVVIYLYLLAPWIKPDGQKNRQQKFHDKRPQLTLGNTHRATRSHTIYQTGIGNQSYRVNSCQIIPQHHFIPWSKSGISHIALIKKIVALKTKPVGVASWSNHTVTRSDPSQTINADELLVLHRSSVAPLITKTNQTNKPTSSTSSLVN